MERKETILNRAVYILDTYKKTRDDKSLFFTLYAREYGPLQFSDVETLSRNWRYIQRKKTELRGKDFYKRQQYARKIARLYATEDA